MIKLILVLIITFFPVLVIAQSVSLTNLRSLAFTLSNDRVDSLLRSSNFSYENIGKTEIENSFYEYMIFKKINYTTGIQELVYIYRDTNVLRKLTPIIKYVCNSEAFFYALKKESDALEDITFRKEETLDKCFTRHYSTFWHVYIYRICNDEKIGKLYTVQVYSNL